MSMDLFSDLSKAPFVLFVKNDFTQLPATEWSGGKAEAMGHWPWQWPWLLTVTRAFVNSCLLVCPVCIVFCCCCSLNVWLFSNEKEMVWIWTGGEMGRIWRSLGRGAVIRVDCMEKTIFDKRKVDKMKIPPGLSNEAFWEPTRLWFIGAVSCLLFLSPQVLILGRFPLKKTWITDYLLKWNVVQILHGKTEDIQN